MAGLPARPRSIMTSAASTSLRNISLRVDMNALVPSTSNASYGIFAVPKPNSRPQIASTTSPGTPYRLSTAASVLACFWARERPPEVTAPMVFSAK